ncbi:MAG: hypothetical protein ACOYI8_01740 [Christensenellales bacterium]|jgi:hypothetical protein
MRRFGFEDMFLAVDFVLPGMVAVCLVAKYGLLWVGAVAVLEWLLLTISNRAGYKARSGMYDVWKAVLTSVGIASGAKLYPVQSSPIALGVAAVILAIVIHAGVYRAMSSLIRK